MSEQANGSTFFLRKAKKPKDKLAHVYQRVTVNGQAKEWSIKRKWDPKRWNQKIGRASDTKEDAKILNDYLTSLSSKVLRAQKSIIDHDKELSGESILRG